MQGSTAASISSAFVIAVVVLGGTLYVAQQNQANQSQLSGLNAQVVALENRPAVTETVVSAVTTILVSTSLVTTTSTSTASVYPIPSNVTVFFTGVAENYDYQISSSSTSISGYTGQNNLAIPIMDLFQGEALTVSVNCNTVGGSSVNAVLYVNGSMVARTGCVFSGSGQMTYTV